MYHQLVPFIDLAIDALATYRLTRLAVEDVVAAPVRQAIFDRYPPHEKSLSYALTCPHCAGVWAGAGVALARTVAPRAWQPVALALALAGVVSLANEWRDK